jgi:DNA-directed RNA polymerase II subunit RPB2
MDKLKKADDSTAREYATRVLMDKVLPHVGMDKSSFRQKAYFIGYMVKKLLYGFLGKVDEDDRDHYGKKRLDMTGTLMIGLFKDQFKNNYIKTAEKIIRRKLHEKKTEIEKQIELVFDPRPITTTLRTALATGNWGKSLTGEVIRSGVAQVLKRDTTFFATLSHLRRVVAPIQSSSKSAKPRLLHNTHFGMICPSETPEGQKIGIVKNFALMAKVTIGLQ